MTKPSSEKYVVRDGGQFLYLRVLPVHSVFFVPKGNYEDLLISTQVVVFAMTDLRNQPKHSIDKPNDVSNHFKPKQRLM